MTICVDYGFVIVMVVVHILNIKPFFFFYNNIIEFLFNCRRKKLMSKQKYRCAGCGMRVASQYASKFRYCNYLGRYFCTGCHTNQLALIPGRILQKWDFNRSVVHRRQLKDLRVSLRLQIHRVDIFL